VLRAAGAPRRVLALAPLVLGLAVLVAPAVWADPTEETPSGARASSDYALGKKAVEAKDWANAIQLLSRAEVQDDRNPDLENLLGYAYRNIGRFDDAFRHYRKALRLNPRHRGAHEYIGEAYLMVNNLPKAEEHLAALKRICLIACEESEDLEKAIAAYRARHGR
jgi:tetratricopeptide (TPR) repeat protein